MIDIEKVKRKELNKWLDNAPHWLKIEYPIDIKLEQVSVNTFGDRVPMICSSGYTLSLCAIFI